LLAADWGHENRLLKLLDDQSTPSARKVRIINLLGEIFATEAVPRLISALKDPDVAVAKAAAVALGNIGSKDSTAALIEVLKTGSPELQAAAAKGLGQLGALHGDFSIIQPLLEALKSDDVRVKTEAAWALGKLPDRRAYDPLYALSKKLTNVRGPDADPNQLKLKEAVYWSMKQIDTWEYLQ
jgi:HEAT repeat protein